MLSPYARQPKRQPKTTVSSGNNGSSWQMIVIILLVGWIVYQQSSNRPIPIPDPVNPDYIDDEDVPDDDKSDGDDQKDDISKIDLDGSYIIRVYETEANQQKSWMVNTLNDDSFWLTWLTEKGMRYYTFDPGSNQDQAKSYIEAAKANDVDVPFIMHGKDAKVVSVVPFDKEANVENIKKLILSKGK